MKRLETRNKKGDSRYTGENIGFDPLQNGGKHQ